MEYSDIHRKKKKIARALGPDKTALLSSQPHTFFSPFLTVCWTQQCQILNLYVYKCHFFLMAMVRQHVIKYSPIGPMSLICGGLCSLLPNTTSSFMSL